MHIYYINNTINIHLLCTHIYAHSLMMLKVITVAFHHDCRIYHIQWKFIDAVRVISPAEFGWSLSLALINVGTPGDGRSEVKWLCLCTGSSYFPKKALERWLYVVIVGRILNDAYIYPWIKNVSNFRSFSDSLCILPSITISYNPRRLICAILLCLRLIGIVALTLYFLLSLQKQLLSVKLTLFFVFPELLA